MDIDWPRNTKHARTVKWDDVKWDYLLVVILILSMQRFQQQVNKNKTHWTACIFGSLSSRVRSICCLDLSRWWKIKAYTTCLGFLMRMWKWNGFFFTVLGFIRMFLSEMPILALALGGITGCFSISVGNTAKLLPSWVSRLIQKSLSGSSMTMVSLTRSWA